MRNVRVTGYRRGEEFPSGDGNPRALPWADGRCPGGAEESPRAGLGTLKGCNPLAQGNALGLRLPPTRP